MGFVRIPECNGRTNVLIALKKHVLLYTIATISAISNLFRLNYEIPNVLFVDLQLNYKTSQTFLVVEKKKQRNIEINEFSQAHIFENYEHIQQTLKCKLCTSTHTKAEICMYCIAHFARGVQFSCRTIGLK